MSTTVTSEETKTTKKATKKKPAAKTLTIYQRLFNAWGELQFLIKDASNDFAKYKYPKADSIIARTRKALMDNGLMLFAPWDIFHHESGKSTLRVWFRLIDPETGEVMTDESPIMYPICERNGMPEDKACSASLTTCYSYYIRQLFMLPRVDSVEELDQIDDRAHTPVKWTPAMDEQIMELVRALRSAGHTYDSDSVRQMIVKRADADKRSVDAEFLNECIQKANRKD